ncbi:MAG: hypothetical protein JRN52_00865 [Nitrososphaerota archaeon]|nr:hypothetical protein [Nitrososphaerota archaeon]
MNSFSSTSFGIVSTFNRKRLFTYVLAILAIVALLSSPAAYASTGLQPKMVGSQWAVYEQKTLPSGLLTFYPGAHATTMSSGGVEFQMPDGTSSAPTFVNYILDSFTTSLSESNAISATIDVVANSGSPSFLGDTFGGYNLATPAFVRLFFQSNLPASNVSSCVGHGSNVNNYWWADIDYYTFPSSPNSLGASSGQIVLSATLNPSNWSNICGKSGSNNPGFDQALANVKYVGLSFGSGYFFASGVGVDGTTGSATFQLLSYTIS